MTKDRMNTNQVIEVGSMIQATTEILFGVNDLNKKGVAVSEDTVGIVTFVGSPEGGSSYFAVEWSNGHVCNIYYGGYKPASRVRATRDILYAVRSKDKTVKVPMGTEGVVVSTNCPGLGHHQLRVQWNNDVASNVPEGSYEFV